MLSLVSSNKLEDQNQNRRTLPKSGRNPTESPIVNPWNDELGKEKEYNALLLELQKDYDKLFFSKSYHSKNCNDSSKYQ
jgi:hypothetical protein